MRASSGYCLVNYDLPESLDHELAGLHIEMLKKGRIIRTPVYNFTTHSREESRSLLVRPKKVLLVSGILTAHAFGEKLDMAIGVKAEESICVTRRCRRDVEERGRTEDKSSLQIEKQVLPAEEEYVRPYLDIKKWEVGKLILVENNENVKMNKGIPGHIMERAEEIAKMIEG